VRKERRLMLSSRPAKQTAGALMGFAICASSTAATAATTSPVSSISPLVALSAFSATGSGSVICAAAGAAAVSAAAEAAPGTGCVLPVVDQPVPAPVQPAPASYVPPPPHAGIGLLPLFGGLAAIVALAGLLMSGHHNGDIDLPLLGPPLSPD
jgi:hypothetical protein